ncbi:MAG: hypothetical protein KZQ99_19880 [Candidatus Thiodiazotropha sp. (ex Dulcina madagascariensis)]|nr:hypothetical protein [Candidatus Thiodiazotropha sp. (ex Dulcina madagascariensis)]
MDPTNVAVAVEGIYAELPYLLGVVQWEQISTEFEDTQLQLKSSQDEVRKMRLAAKLVGLLAPHEAARRRLQEALQALDVRRATLLAVAELAEQVGHETAVAAALRQAASQPNRGETRLVIVSAGGTQAKSIKLGNLRLDYGAAAEFAAGVLAMIHSIVSDETPLLLAAGALLLLRGLEKMTTVGLSEREATVFWGCAQASDEEKMAKENKILWHANRERARVGLKPLTVSELKNALFNLAQLRCVQRNPELDGIWQIREHYLK